MSITGAQQISFQRFAENVWNNVAPQRLTPMQQHIWIRAAAEALSSIPEVQVVTIGSPDQPAALAPLCKSASGSPRLKLLGAEELGESVEVVYRDPGALDLLARAIADTGLPVSFGHYPLDSPFIEALRRAYRGRGFVVTKPLAVRGCPHIVLDESWIEPERHLSSNRRWDFRRKQRRAAELGKVTFSILQPRSTELTALFEEAIGVEAKGWKGRSATCITRDRILRRFFQRYTELACVAGILRLCFMRIDDKPVAMQLAVETNDCFWPIKIGYDEDYARCSPGNLLMRETISYAARNKLKSFEFLGKSAPWTEIWTQDARPIAALRTYPLTTAGGEALAFDVAMVGTRWISKKWHQHLYADKPRFKSSSWLLSPSDRTRE